MERIKVLGSPLYQWELGRKIEITPPANTGVDKVEFSHVVDTEALSVKPREENGIIVADIPNIMLQSGSPIFVYLVYTPVDSLETTASFVLSVIKRPKPADYVYTETEVWSYEALEARMKVLEDDLYEQVASSIENYLEKNPPGGVDFETDNTLILKDGILSVNTTDQMEQDNTLPITSAGVYATVGNIEALLKTI